MNVTPTVVLDFTDHVYLDMVNTSDCGVRQLWDHLTMSPPPSRVCIVVGAAQHVAWAFDLVSVLTMVRDVEIVGMWPAAVEDAAIRLQDAAARRAA